MYASWEFSYAIFICGLCGLMMVAGSIYLLRTGVIQMVEAAKSGQALSIEVENKIKVSTSYPALGLFIIGLVFIILAVYSTKPTGLMEINLTGKVNIDDASKVSIKVEPVMELPLFQTDDQGNLDQPFYPNFRRVHVEVHAAGYAPEFHEKNFPVNQGTLKLPETWQFTKTNQPAPSPGPIAPVPANVKLPPPFQPSS